MMNPRLCSFLTLAAIAWVPLQVGGAAYAETSRELRIPLKGSLALPADGGIVDVDAMVSLFTSASPGVNSGANVDYMCEIVGRATANSGGSPYVATGMKVGSLQSDSPLPSDVGFTCALTLASAQSAQTFQVRIQGSIDMDGALASAVVLDTTPVP